ncbi:MAG: hypothetical protein J1E65_07745 [Lachnospiraceae bacterium]|nr:hypothetical protein [Lachnospiraceae bacterium]
MRKKILLLLLSGLLLCAGCGNGAEGPSAPESAPSTQESISPEGDQTEQNSPADVWQPKEAPPVRNALTDEEKLSRQIAILGKGIFLFSGQTDEGYSTDDLSFLEGAGGQDALALIYVCDDESHAGWGVLGWGGNVAGQYVKGADVPAMSDPTKERVVMITMKELAEMFGVDSTAEMESLILGAWNGGRIAGLYFVTADLVQEWQDCVAEIDSYEQIIHTYSGGLSNENAIENAKTLYAYLQETYGQYCLTGQMESTWMTSPDYEMDYLMEHTGKLPAIRGLDFMHNDFEGVVDRAIEWWEQGGIPTICWHTGADFASGYDECLADNINWEEAFVPGSETYNSLLVGMDRAVPYLQQLEDAGVPVLWRPFHELDGGWFWWSKGGSDNFVKLWQLMYSRYTDYWGLDNLIWVYGYSGNGETMAEWYPGDAYVDLLGADSYAESAEARLYEECVKIAPEGMPIVFHECGRIPTEEELKEAEAAWLFFMVWHTSWLTEEKNQPLDALYQIYNSDYFITLDELPDFK